MPLRRHTRYVDDVGDLCDGQPDGDKRSAPQAEGSPFDAQLNSRLRCCTGRILLLNWQPETPSKFQVGPLTWANVVGVTGFEPAASSSRTTGEVVAKGR